MVKILSKEEILKTPLEKLSKMGVIGIANCSYLYVTEGVIFANHIDMEQDGDEYSVYIMSRGDGIANLAIKRFMPHGEEGMDIISQ